MKEKRCFYLLYLDTTDKENSARLILSDIEKTFFGRNFIILFIFRKLGEIQKILNLTTWVKEILVISVLRAL